MKSRLKWNGKSVQPMRSTPANCNNVSDDLVVTATRMNQDGDALKHMNQHNADTDPESQLEAILAAEGENCDQTACGQGGFGAFTNPVPVAGLDGMMEYLRSLRGSTGQELSIMIKDVRISNLLDHPVETYEAWTKDESQKALINFSRFHPRSSTLAPEGFHLVGGKQ
jgi:hypothetical protein